VTVEEGLGLVQPLLGEADVAAPTQHQRAAAEMPDGEADVVADDGGYEGYETDRHYIEPARARVDRGGDEHGLAGHGNPEVLQHDQEQDGPVAEVIQRPSQRVEEAGQRRGTAAGQDAHANPFCPARPATREVGGRPA